MKVPLNILIVEDDEDTRFNVRDILELDHHNVAFAGTAEAARTIIKTQAISVVLLDRRLPDGNADSLLTEFKELSPNTDYIIVTGFADLDSTIAALRHGAVDYILKPINSDALRASIQRIANRRTIERELHREHEFADRILKTAEAIVVVLDFSGRIIRLNPYLAKVTSHAISELINQDWFETFVPEREREGAREAFLNVAEKIETRGIVSPILTKSGSLRQVRWSNTTLKDERGKSTSVLAIGLDITDLIDVQQRIVQSERLASIGQTMTALAHESRNALQRIQASAEVLQLEFENDPHVHGDLMTISRAVKDLRGLLEEVRDFAAPIQLEPQSVLLRDVWRRAWKNLEPEMESRNVQLKEKLDDPELVLGLDDVRMEQVFRNLFENSLAACSDPTVIEVSTRKCEDQIQITVRDNGPGLGHEQQDKVFEAFYTTKPTGTGLGMAIVRRIVEAHRGAIRVEDGVAHGAAFTMQFPLPLRPQLV